MCILMNCGRLNLSPLSCATQIVSRTWDCNVSLVSFGFHLWSQDPTNAPAAHASSVPNTSLLLDWRGSHGLTELWKGTVSFSERHWSTWNLHMSVVPKNILCLNASHSRMFQPAACKESIWNKRQNISKLTNLISCQDNVPAATGRMPLGGSSRFVAPPMTTSSRAVRFRAELICAVPMQQLVFCKGAWARVSATRKTFSTYPLMAPRLRILSWVASWACPYKRDDQIWKSLVTLLLSRCYCLGN